MKKSFLTLMLLTAGMFSNAQIKSTGVVTMGTQMSLKIDLDQTTSTVTMTITGPSTKWFAVGFNATTMSTNTPIDCISYGTALLDRYLNGGHNAPVTDTTNNLTLVSNTVSGTTRTIVVSRPFSTGDNKDYTFTYAMSSLSVIWAVGPSTTISQEHSSFGSKALTFTLGAEDFSSLNTLAVYPNPSSGIFSITKNSNQTINKVRVFDINAKLIDDIDNGFEAETIQVDLSNCSKGMYFIEISNDNEKIVKKVNVI